jgi:putative hydrolase of the HAD superfamily
LKELGLTAEECVFVDDTEQYLQPAAELGFATVHAVDPRGRWPPWRPCSASP